MIYKRASSPWCHWRFVFWLQQVFGTLIVTGAIGLTQGAAQDELASDAWGNSAAREALSTRDYPWYDESADDLRALDIDPVVPPPDAQNWRLKAPKWEAKGPNWNWSFDFWQIVEWMIWGSLIGLLIGAFAYFIRSTIRNGGIAWGSSRPANSKKMASEFEQIENLPFPVTRPKTDLLAEARYHYENADFGQAIIYLFSYQLVQLDKHHLIHLAKGKTNRQYLRELGNSGSSLRAMLQQTMVAFEEVFFGSHPLDRRAFEDCWQQLDEFHQGVHRHGPLAVN